VFLTSRVVDFILVFRIGLVNGDPDIPASLADPRPIFLPQHPYHIVSGRLPSSLLFRTIEFHYEGNVKDRSADPYLFRLFSLYEDLSIVEHLYSSTEPGFRPTEGVASLSTLPTPVPTSLHGSPSTDTDLRDFVVPDDWYEEDSNAPGAGRCRHPRYIKERKSVLQAHRIHDWQDVYAYVTDESNSLTPNPRTQMDALFAQLADELDRSKSPGIRTLSEVLSSSLHITDVDDDSERFEELISTVSSKQGRNIRLERLPVILSDGQERHRLPSIYDSLVATYLTPLSPQAPDPVRVNKERLVRRVTADLLLASTAVSPICKTAADPFNSDVVSEPRTSHSADYLPSSAQTNLRRSSTPIKTPAVAEEDPIIAHLRSYTTISRPTTSPMPPISTSPILTSILRHLPISPSIDPRTYDWRTTERSLAAEHEEQLAIAAGKADPRAKRKAEKAKLARARREEARRRAAEEIAASSRSMPKVLSSQAGISGKGSSGDGREVQSSQVRPSAWDLQAGSSQGQGVGPGQGQEMGQELPMTQPERGAFGTRSSVMGVQGKKKDKGKKRAAGF
jgi:RNA polymerase I-specific transcription initiation factor RRN6